jgi:hypothetical protein
MKEFMLLGEHEEESS